MHTLNIFINLKVSLLFTITPVVCSLQARAPIKWSDCGAVVMSVWICYLWFFSWKNLRFEKIFLNSRCVLKVWSYIYVIFIIFSIKKKKNVFFSIFFYFNHNIHNHILTYLNIFMISPYILPARIRNFIAHKGCRGWCLIWSFRNGKSLGICSW